MPAGGRYASYVELERAHVAWNVYATAFDAMTPVRWCFPVAGCVAYRGYFSEARAERYARRLAARGFDTHVRAVDAYSTLGWFDDPLLSTFVDRWPPALAELLFHELAHVRLYVSGDSAFSESFATVVGREGVARWLERHGESGWAEAWAAAVERRDAFARFVDGWRTRLAELYTALRATGADHDAIRRVKDRAFAAMRREYQVLAAGWPVGRAGRRPFEAVVTGGTDGGASNARLLPVSTYQRWVPALRALLAEEDGDLPSFYRRAERLAELSAAERGRRLRALTPAVAQSTSIR